MTTVRRRVLDAVAVAAALAVVGAGAIPLAEAASAAPSPRTAQTASSVRAVTAVERSEQLGKLRRKLATYLSTRDSSTTVAFHDSATGVTFTYAGAKRISTASIVKLDILVVLLLHHQRAHTTMSASERALVKVMIEQSDNAAASVLYRRIGGAPGLAAANKKLGLRGTTPSTASWGLSTTSAADQVRLLRVLTRSASPLTPAHRRYVRRLMHDVTSWQHWGVSVAGDLRTVTELKNGWAPRSADGDLWAVNSVGLVTIGGRTVQVAVLSRSSATMADGVKTVEHVARLVRATVLTLR